MNQLSREKYSWTVTVVACLAFGILCETGCSRSSDVPEEVDPGRVSVPSISADTTPGGSAHDWPCWRGPEGTGVSRESGWTTDWPKDGPTVLWRTNVGTGFSTVSIVGNRLFTMGRRANQDLVCCLDTANGSEIWAYSYPGALSDEMHEGGPGATPTIDDNRVYTLGREAQLHCLNAENGEVIWKRLLKEELDLKQPQWGFTCSPLIVGDMLVLDVGPLIALNKENGKTIWQTEEHQAGYGTPTRFTLADDELLAVLNNDGLLIVKATDGTKIDLAEWETNYNTNSTTPIVVGDTIFVSSGYGKGCGLFQLKDKALEPVYANRRMRNHFNSCVLWDGYLFGFDGNNTQGRGVRLVCMEYATGKQVWAERGFRCGSLMIADGKLIILSETGELVIANASPEGLKELARTKVLDGRCWTIPVLAAGRIYCRNAAGDLVCLDVSGKRPNK